MREVLKQLCGAWGPPGHEGQVRDVIGGLLGHKYGNNIRTDTMGNLIVGDGRHAPRLMVVAHMDETGLFITDIDESGFLRFSPAGPLQPEAVFGQTVVFANGTEAVVGREGGDHDKLELSQLYLDLGAQSRAAATEKVPVGSFGALASTWRELGDRVASTALHNRVGCAVLVEALRQLDILPVDVVFVFAAQGKLDQRGTKTVAQALQPEFGLAVDTMPVGDTPKAVTKGVSLGNGAVIKVRDQNVISHPEMRQWLLDLAEARDIRYQHGVQTSGHSEGGPLHIAGLGVPTGLISVPIRNQGTAVEVVDLADVAANVRLLKAAVEG